MVRWTASAIALLALACGPDTQHADAHFKLVPVPTPTLTPQTSPTATPIASPTPTKVAAHTHEILWVPLEED